MTVDDNLRLAAGFLPSARRASRIAAMYEAFPDLARQRRLLAGRLSGGQRQMLAIARALLAEPKALMLDEPSAGLSPKFVEIVFAKLAEIRNSGVTIVLVEQNTRAALALADRAYVLVQGCNRHEGEARALRDDPTSPRFISAALRRRASRESASGGRRTDERRLDRIGRDRRHADLFDPALRQLRSWRIHHFRRLRGDGDRQRRLDAGRRLRRRHRRIVDQPGADPRRAVGDGS